MCCCVIRVSKNVSAGLYLTLGFRESHVSHTGLYVQMAMIEAMTARLRTALSLKKATIDVVDLTGIGEKPLRKSDFCLVGCLLTDISLRKW